MPGASTQSPSKLSTKTKAEPKTPSESKVKANPQPRVKSEPKVKEETIIKTASPIKKATKVKEEDYDSRFTRDDEKGGPKQHNVTGVYNLSCPQLEEQLPNSASNLRMFLCVDGDKAWGGFQLAMKSGVIHIDNIDANDLVRMASQRQLGR